MSESTRDIKTKLESGLRSVEQLRDEVRVKIHLGALDAKKRWDALEPRIEAALEHAAKDASEASSRVLDEAIDLLKKFRDSLSTRES